MHKLNRAEIKHAIKDIKIRPYLYHINGDISDWCKTIRLSIIKYGWL